MYIVHICCSGCGPIGKSINNHICKTERYSYLYQKADIRYAFSTAYLVLDSLIEHEEWLPGALVQELVEQERKPK